MCEHNHKYSREVCRSAEWIPGDFHELDELGDGRRVQIVLVILNEATHCLDGFLFAANVDFVGPGFLHAFKSGKSLGEAFFLQVEILVSLLRDKKLT